MPARVRRTYIANVDADIHESNVVGERKVNKSLEVRVRFDLLVASQPLLVKIRVLFSYVDNLPARVRGRQKSQEFPRWPEMELITLLHIVSTHLTSLHYEEVALDGG